jgi:hypothetical protein
MFYLLRNIRGFERRENIGYSRHKKTGMPRFFYEVVTNSAYAAVAVSAASRPTNSTIAIGAASPLRLPHFRTRV